MKNKDHRRSVPSPGISCNVAEGGRNKLKPSKARENSFPLIMAEVTNPTQKKQQSILSPSKDSTFHERRWSYWFQTDRKVNTANNLFPHTSLLSFSTKTTYIESKRGLENRLRMCKFAGTLNLS